MQKHMNFILLVLTAFLAMDASASHQLQTQKVQFKQVVKSYYLDGVVEAELGTTISSQTNGQVLKVLFDVNDDVKKGEVVVLIDDTQQQATLRRAKANEKEAEARLSEARQEYERVKAIYAKKVVSKSAFDKAQAALKSAKARLESARAARAQAEESLAYTRVKAPFSGVLTKRLIDKGAQVNVGTPLVSGVSLEKLRVKTYVPQSIYKSVYQHQQASILFDDQIIVSKDMTFFPFADPVSHSFELRIQLPNNQANLRPGMAVKVAMVVSSEKKLVIPQQAVAYRGEVTGVYVKDDTGLHFRHVRLGHKPNSNEVTVLSGLDANDNVVLDPVAAAIQIKQAITH